MKIRAKTDEVNVNRKIALLDGEFVESKKRSRKVKLGQGFRASQRIL